MGQPWSPPGIPRPWPADEYVIDGGDRAGQVNVARDWTVHGLDEEDTVVHYDTLEGKVVIQPSNRVAVYAPRFAAVRATRCIRAGVPLREPWLRGSRLQARERGLRM